MKTSIFSILLVSLSLTLFSQTKKQTVAKPNLPKTVIATYDSAMTLAFADLSWIYFTSESDKKVITFAPPNRDENPKMFKEFWEMSVVKRDTLDGTEWHTKEYKKGKKYELSYKTVTVEMEGGMGNVNVLLDYALYDSIYIIKKQKLAAWKIDDKKIDAKNIAPNNPSSIAKKYVDACNKGDFKTMSMLAVNKEQAATIINEGDCFPNIIESLEKIDKKIIQKNSPEGAKIELAKVMLNELTLEYQLKKPVTHYLSESDAISAIWAKGDHLLFLGMKKIGTSWKITFVEDNIPCKSLKKDAMFKEVFLLKVKEEKK